MAKNDDDRKGEAPSKAPSLEPPYVRRIPGFQDVSEWRVIPTSQHNTALGVGVPAPEYAVRSEEQPLDEEEADLTPERKAEIEEICRDIRGGRRSESRAGSVRVNVEPARVAPRSTSRPASPKALDPGRWHATVRIRRSKRERLIGIAVAFGTALLVIAIFARFALPRTTPAQVTKPPSPPTLLPPNTPTAASPPSDAPVTSSSVASPPATHASARSTNAGSAQRARPVPASGRPHGDFIPSEPSQTPPRTADSGSSSVFKRSIDTDLKP